MFISLFKSFNYYNVGFFNIKIIKRFYNIEVINIDELHNIYKIKIQNYYLYKDIIEDTEWANSYWAYYNIWEISSILKEKEDNLLEFFENFNLKNNKIDYNSFNQSLNILKIQFSENLTKNWFLEFNENGYINVKKLDELFKIIKKFNTDLLSDLKFDIKEFLEKENKNLMKILLELDKENKGFLPYHIIKKNYLILG